MANWDLIKAEYITGVPPRDLAKKYKITANTISNRASLEQWDKDKQKKCEEIAQNFDKQIKDLTTVAISKLMDLLLKNEIKDNDLINAIGKVIDISGLKSVAFSVDTPTKVNIIMQPVKSINRN